MYPVPLLACKALTSFICTMPTLIDNSGNLVYFGRLTWANFVDWLVTLCLGLIIIVTTVSLGGVRADTHLLILPLFAVLLVLHGLWYVAEKERPLRLSPVPLWFMPVLLLYALSSAFLSPAPWRGWVQLVYLLEAFCFLWVLVNNVRTRAHLWLLLLMACVPIGYAAFLGCFQFFQNPEKVADAMTLYSVRLSPDMLGRATGCFADPHAYAVLILAVIPLFLFAASVSRLSFILRVLCYYISLMLSLGLMMVTVFWPLPILLMVFVLVPYFALKDVKQRLRWMLISSLVLFAGAALVGFFHPLTYQGILQSLFEHDGVYRLLLWQEAWQSIRDNWLLGTGAGSYSMTYEQSGRSILGQLPSNPMSDLVWIAQELGLIGLSLFFLPIVAIVFGGMRRLKQQPFSVILKGGRSKRKVMAPQRFFTSLGVLGGCSLILCLLVNGFCHVPGLLLFGVLVLSILIKSCFERVRLLPDRMLIRWMYCAAAFGSGVLFVSWAMPLLHSSGLELHARQQLDALHAENVHVSGDPAVLDFVIQLYEESCQQNPRNVDAWIGLSAANAQLFFRMPSKSEEIAKRSVEYASRALDLADDYWRCWAQLGVGYALLGDVEAAGQAFDRAVELAPNSSSALYYWAAFSSRDATRVREATHAVERALELDPDNEAARRLLQKLRIL